MKNTERFFCCGIPIEPGERCQICGEAFDDELKSRCPHCNSYPGQLHKMDCPQRQEQNEETKMHTFLENEEIALLFSRSSTK